MENMFLLFKAILNEDKCPVVVCDTNHTIVYMNPASIEKYHGNLVGSSIFDCHKDSSCEFIKRVFDWFEENANHNRIYTYRNDKENKDVYMVALRDETGKLLGYYEKHEFRNAESSMLYDFT